MKKKSIRLRVSLVFRPQEYLVFRKKTNNNSDGATLSFFLYTQIYTDLYTTKNRNLYNVHTKYLSPQKLYNGIEYFHS